MDRSYRRPRIHLPPNDFHHGDHVLIKPCDNVPARVIGVTMFQGHWMYSVRYFINGEAKTVDVFPDELILQEVIES